MSREKIGKFEIIRHLARGGMADVFLARVEGLEGFEKLCVLKRMLPDLMASDEHVQMFLDEARIAGALHHANIVQVYDVGVADGKYFLAMEYLSGYDVSRVFRALSARGEQMPFEQAVHIVASICAGLHHAHECRDPHGVPMGIVHRDISPQNVFVSFDGHVKLMDFGIAKASKRSTRTRSGVLKGKLGYMAPEQAQGKRLDRRADIFATAVILWELTTGRRLHPSRNEYEILKAIVERAAPLPSTLRDDYPPELERIVMQGLSKDPSGRYSTALEMQHDLEQLARDAGMTLAPTSIATLMTRLFPEGHELGLTGSNPIVGQGTIVDDDFDETDEGSFAEARSAVADNGPARASLSTVPDTSPGWYAERHVASPSGDDVSTPAVVPLEDQVPPSDARISRAATAELELQRPGRSLRSLAWMGVVAAGLLTLIGVGAFGYARSNDSLEEGRPDVSAAAWSPAEPGSSASSPSLGSDVTPDAASSSPVSSAPAPVVSASAAPKSPGTVKPPRPKPKPPKPKPPKPAPTWDYDSPLPP